MNDLLKGKNITICVTGGIAAYKTVSLCSLFIKAGADVRVIMSENACEFITPLTFKTITKNPVITKMFDTSDFIPHISISELSDLIIAAPATANCIAKAASGIADDMISTVLLSSKAPKIIVPAMNTAMYENVITQKNIEILKNAGFYVMEPDSGLMACGTSGAGRFPEIERIYGETVVLMSEKNSIYSGKKILITAGGTIEDIDPVRYISNRSSGKTAFSFAEELIKKGADIKIICGNVSDTIISNFTKKYGSGKIINVRSAMEMKNKAALHMEESDILIMCAAVADYKPEYSNEKIKKRNDELTLKLEKTDDILGSLKKKEGQIFIGFAAESSNLEEYAFDKLKRKKLDYIIANNITGEKSAFASDKSEFIILSESGERKIIQYNYKSLNSKLSLDFIEESILNKV